MLEVGPVAGEDLRPPGEGEGAGAHGQPSLSDRFGPFLDRFVRMASRVGGRALVAREAGNVVGLLLTDPEDRTASLFTRSADVARALWPERDGLATYAEIDLPLAREEYLVYAGPTDAQPPHRFRHRVRLLAPEDATAVAELLHEVYGGAPLRWLGIARGEGEVGFGVDLGGQFAGVAWVLVAGEHARLHGLTVRPGARRIGIGSDLLAARLLFAQREGAHGVISEIAAGNAASRAVAERGGMRRAGSLYLYAPDRPEVGDPVRVPRNSPGTTIG